METRASERRKHKRDILTVKAEILTKEGKIAARAASFDVSEGGIRVVTNTHIEDKFVIVLINKEKYTARVIHVEKRKSSVMETTAYYYGLQFSAPIRPNQKQALLLLSQKAGF